MHAALRRVDIVGEGYQNLIISVVILQRDLAFGIFPCAGHIYDFLVQRVFVSVYISHELADAAGVVHDILLLFTLAPVFGAYTQAGVQKRLLAHTGMQGIVVVDRLVKHLRVRVEPDHRSGTVRLSDDGHFLGYLPAGELHLIDLAVFVDADLQPIREGVDDRGADAVQSAGDLIPAAAEFAARMQYGVDDLERGLARLFLDIHRYTAPVIRDADDVPRLYDDLDIVAITGQRFVYGVVHDLVDQVVQAGSGSRTDVHTGTKADSLQSLKYLDLTCVVFLSDLFANIGHIASPYLLDNAALERDESQTLRVPRSSQRMKDRGRSTAAFMTSPAFSEAASSSRVEREKVVLSISQMATMEFFLTTFPPPIFRYITASCLPRP